MPATWSVAVGTLFGAIYLALAPHVVGVKDSPEFTLVLAANGVAHPTGYPWYVIAGHAFVTVLHALGASWAYAANAWSAVGGGVAMGLFHALGARLVPARVGRRSERAALALVATALVGLNPVWLLDAMLAEVYSWHLAWVCGACLYFVCTVRALAATGRRPESARPGRRAIVWGMLCGLGLAHHVTAVFFVAPLSVAIAIAAWRAGAWRAWLPVTFALGALVPLAGYGFIAWRAWHPAAFQWSELGPSWASVFAHIAGAEYRSLLGRFAPDPTQAALFAHALYPLLFPGMALVLWWAVRAPDRASRIVLGALFAAAAIQTLYAFEYGVNDPSSYFQPGLALAALAVPLTAGAIGSPALRRGFAAAAATLAVVMGVVWLGVGLETRRDAIALESQVHAAWRSIPADRGIVLWQDDRYPTLLLYQMFDHERSGIFVTNPTTLSWEPGRRRFAARFGFDPLAGLVPLTLAKAQRIPDNINARTDLPVVVFDPDRPRQEVLAKAAPGAIAP